MTLDKYIASIEILTRNTSDDSKYSDEFIYDQIKSARAFVLSRRLSSSKIVSSLNYQSFCMPLEITTYYDCDCLPVEFQCKVLKSKYKLPQFLTNKFKEIFKVKTIDGTEIGKTSNPQLKIQKYSKTQKDKIKYEVVDGYLVIHNVEGLDLKVVVIEGILTDPTELAEISLCSTTGEESDEPCYNIHEDDFPVDGDLVFDIEDIVVKKLVGTMQIPEDITNDAKSELNVKNQR